MFDFYAAHEVDEICVADPLERTLQWFVLRSGTYVPTARSDLSTCPSPIWWHGSPHRTDRVGVRRPADPRAYA